jgi:TolB-like protein
MDRVGPYQGDEPYVFVSYSHRDEKAMLEEVTSLQAAGINVWYDEGIEAGTEWREELATAISRAQCLVYYITANSAGSENCRREVHYAVDRGVPVIAVHVEDVDLPEGTRLAISDRQALMQHRLGREETRRRLVSRLGGLEANPQNGRKRSGNQRGLAVGLAALLLIAAAAGSWVIVDSGRTAGSVPDLSIAVLPFEQLGGSDDLALLAAAVREDVLTHLSETEYCGLMQCLPIRVASGAVTNRYDDPRIDPIEISEHLGVGYLLRASVRDGLDSTVLSAELLRAVDGAQIWARRYEIDPSSSAEDREVLATNLAFLASSELGFDVDLHALPLDPEFADVEPDALAQFQAALGHYRRWQLGEQSGRHLEEQSLERAIRADPDFDRPYINLLGIYAFRSGGLSFEEAQAKVNEVLPRARQVDSVDRMLEEATANILLDLDYASAQKLLQTTLKGTPRWETWHHHLLARIALREGRLDDGKRHLNNAMSLHAGFEQASFLAMNGWLSFLAGEYGQAVRLAQEGLAFGATGPGLNTMFLTTMAAFWATDQRDRAERLLSELEGVAHPASLTPVYAWLGREGDARVILESRADADRILNEHYFRALTHLLLEEFEPMFDEMRASIHVREPLLSDTIRLSVLWNPVRNDPRFAVILEELEALETPTPEFMARRDRAD